MVMNAPNKSRIYDDTVGFIHGGKWLSLVSLFGLESLTLASQTEHQKTYAVI